MKIYIQPFNEMSSHDVTEVGGKNASLGEMFSELESEGIEIPDGFATTAEAYREFIDHNELRAELSERLDRLDREEYSNLQETGEQLRTLIMEAEMPEELTGEIKEAYEQLKDRVDSLSGVAVRSSATAEDLPEASFAGQHDSFMNIRDPDTLVDTVQRCYASLFTDRAIKYREDNGFEHMDVALSAGVQKMVRSDLACAGVAFTIEPDTGFEKVIFINSSWGLGDNVVAGRVQGDQFYVYKRNLRENRNAILSKVAGTKEQTMVYGEGSDRTENVETPEEKRNRFTLTDEEITRLARWCLKIEEHYGKPQDIEWAKDGESEKIFIVQSRPETVHSSREGSKLKQYSLKSKGEVIVTGSGIGDRIAAGKARILQSPEEADQFEEGEVLVTEITNPDWDPIMEKAAAFITDSGGRTSHAAIVAREIGTAAIVGAENATEVIRDGQEITVSSAEAQQGRAYDGILEWEEEEIDLEELGETDTEVMLILSNARSGYRYGDYPVSGVGLLRLEFAITDSIGIHPMALLRFDELEDDRVKEQIRRLTAAYESGEAYFVEKLSMAVATIAACFYPRQVIVRMSDFKSNEYASLLGGKRFEPEEENPMLGFRGASRYTHEKYREGFRMECEAMKRAREEMGLDNITLMIPFCRTVEEARNVIGAMSDYGLRQGEGGLEIYGMVELPSNVIGMKDFAELFDGFSIGSNDLTQLVLGVDRDSDLVSGIFDERNDQVRQALAEAIRKAREKGKKIGLCGQAPSDFPEVARFLVEEGIDSISFNPDAIAKGIRNIMKAENSS